MGQNKHLMRQAGAVALALKTTMRVLDEKLDAVETKVDDLDKRLSDLETSLENIIAVQDQKQSRT